MSRATELTSLNLSYQNPQGEASAVWQSTFERCPVLSPLAACSSSHDLLCDEQP